jgi:hypothetical protein
MTRGRGRDPVTRRRGGGTLQPMGNSSATGSFGTRILAWAIVIVVALIAAKIVFGIVIGLVQFLFSIVLIGLVVLGVLWALRHL